MKNENDLKKIMRSHRERVLKMKLPIVLGIDSKNKPKIVDLAKVGNILVGGASGQGKTNLLRAIAKSCFYAPPKVYQGCIVYYIDSKGVEEFSPYFAIQLNETDEIRKDLEMLCDKISKRESDKKISRYPIALMIDDFDHLILTDKCFLEKIEFIAMRGPRVGIYMVLTTARAECDILSMRLRAESPTRVAFRVASAVESRSIIYRPDAVQLTHKGEMFLSHNGKLTKLQTINVVDDNGE